MSETMYLRPKYFLARENESERDRWNRCIDMLSRELRQANPDQFNARVDYLTGIASGYAMGRSRERLAHDIRRRIR
jgi:hypothetical protein